MSRNTRGIGLRHTEGKELIRIEGVYMYVILSKGDVAALTGHKTLTITMIEDRNDEESQAAFLSVGKWIYPLTRSSPIIISEQNAIVMPDIFGPAVPHGQQIAVKLPQMMTLSEMKILLKIFRHFSYVKGFFKTVGGKEICIRGTETAKSIKEPAKDCVDVLKTKHKRDEANMNKFQSPAMKFRNQEAGCHDSQPFKRGVLGLYTIGPQDPAFFKIQTAPQNVNLHFLLYNAVECAISQVNKYYKSMRYDQAMLPIFDRRFETEYMKYQVNAVDKLESCGCYGEDVIRAALIFDKSIKESKLDLIDFQSVPSKELKIKAANGFAAAIIEYTLVRQYGESKGIFTTLHIVSEIESYRQYFNTERSIKGIEQCDHHIEPFYECYAEKY